MVYSAAYECNPNKEIAVGKQAVTVLRWGGTCPSCGAKRSIIKKLDKNQAYCEKCGLGFTDRFLEEYAAKLEKGDANRTR